jgi:hypothetical protein
MISYLKLHKIGSCQLNFLNPWITEFSYTATFCTDQVIVLFALVGLLKLGNIFSKLMLNDKIAIQK